jgi:Recombinase zinc beta ribbon domain
MLLSLLFGQQPPIGTTSRQGGPAAAACDLRHPLGQDRRDGGRGSARAAQLLLAERSGSPRAQAADATDYLLTSFLRCQRCGHGFVGTAAHGNGGTYRYYTCFSRQRHGSARCDQQRLLAGLLGEAIVAEVLAALDDGGGRVRVRTTASLVEPLGHPTGVGADDLRTSPAGR